MDEQQERAERDALLAAIDEALPKVGEPEMVWCMVHASHLRAARAALAQPAEAKSAPINILRRAMDRAGIWGQSRIDLIGFFCNEFNAAQPESNVHQAKRLSEAAALPPVPKDESLRFGHTTKTLQEYGTECWNAALASTQPSSHGSEQDGDSNGL